LLNFFDMFFVKYWLSIAFHHKQNLVAEQFISKDNINIETFPQRPRRTLKVYVDLSIESDVFMIHRISKRIK